MKKISHEKKRKKERDGVKRALDIFLAYRTRTIYVYYAPFETIFVGVVCVFLSSKNFFLYN